MGRPETSRSPLLIRLSRKDQQQPQQTGVPFIITQQVQPFLRQEDRQSQQDWIISQHFGSPLVQVKQTPLSVVSHLHMPIVKLQQQTIMPFIMQQAETMPPASIWQRFWTMLQAILSSQLQDILKPPVHFSSLKVQRGTIIQVPPGIVPAVPGAAPVMPAMPGIIMLVRSIIIVLDI